MKKRTIYRVLNAFESELKNSGVGQWTKPDGGFFITYKAENGCAKRIVELCAQAGVSLTAAGATHPYGHDPEDAFIRIAPTFPPLEELQQALEVFCTAAKLAVVEKVIERRLSNI